MTLVHFLRLALGGVAGSIQVGHVVDRLEIVDPYEVFAADFGSHKALELIGWNEALGRVLYVLRAVQWVYRLLQVGHLLNRVELHLLRLSPSNGTCSEFLKSLHVLLRDLHVDLFERDIL